MSMSDSLTHEEDAPHELKFTAAAASWMNLIIDKNPGLPFSEARCEGRTRGSQKRRDISLRERDGKVLVTGEVKLPYQKDGQLLIVLALFRTLEKRPSVQVQTISLLGMLTSAFYGKAIHKLTILPLAS